MKFYQQYGVEEYYIYDPDELSLQGWRRQKQALVPIEALSGWISPRLKIRLEWEPEQELVLFRPDGQRFLNFLEVDQQFQDAQQHAQEAEHALSQERERTQRMAALLQSMGVDPDQLPEDKER